MFSWSNGGRRRPSSSTSTYPGNRQSAVATTVSGSIRPPTFTRQQHLDSYLNDATLKPSTRRVSSDDTTYDTVFQTTTGNALILRVRLPRSPHVSAPCRPPAMTLVGVRATHGWLDSRMCIVGYNVISTQESWEASGTLLGVAVNAVVREMQLNPPQILEITDPGLQLIQQRVSGGNTTTTNNNNTPRRNSRLNHAHPDAPPDYESLNIPEISLPPIPTEFPQLDDMSRNELQSVLEDELEFLSLVHQLPCYKQVQNKALSALEENVALARANLAKESHVKELYGQVVTQKADLVRAVNEFQTYESQQNQIVAPPDPMQLLRQLQKAKKQALDESEHLANEWVDHGGDMDGFIDQFLEIRKVHHSRAAKLERLKVMKK